MHSLTFRVQYGRNAEEAYVTQRALSSASTGLRTIMEVRRGGLPASAGYGGSHSPPPMDPPQT